MGNLFKRENVTLRNDSIEECIPELNRKKEAEARREAIEKALQAPPEPVRIPHVEIGKAIIDATDVVREGLRNAKTPSEIDTYVDILAKIDEMHWKNTEKVTLFAN